MKKLLASENNVKCQLISKGNNTENARVLLRILNRANVLNNFFFRATTATAQSNARTLRQSLSRNEHIQGKVEVQLHLFLTSALDRGQCSSARPGERTPVPLNGRLAGPQIRSEHFGNEINLLPQP